MPALKEYQVLVNTDPEVDFFYNIVHLQVAILSSMIFRLNMFGSWISHWIVLSAHISKLIYFGIT